MPALPAETAEEEAARQLDQVFGALADPVRRSILERLDGQDCLVSELAAAYPISLQAVSRHIQVLAAAGLVEQTRTGRISRCHHQAAPIAAAAAWINRYAKYCDTQFQTLAKHLLELDRTRRL